jgi:hypothetical protein
MRQRLPRIGHFHLTAEEPQERGRFAALTAR